MAEPAQISAARMQAIVDDWIDYIDGNLGDRWIRAMPSEYRHAGGWSESDNGLYLTNTDIADPLVFSFPHESSLTVKGMAAMLYTSSTVTSEQPNARMIEIDDTGVTEIGIPLVIPTTIGWDLYTISTTHTIAADAVLGVRITAGHIGDRVGAVFVQGDRL